MSKNLVEQHWVSLGLGTDPDEIGVYASSSPGLVKVVVVDVGAADISAPKAVAVAKALLDAAGVRYTVHE